MGRARPWARAPLSPLPAPPPEEESGGKKSLVYHLSDSIYGTFSCLLFDSPCPRPQLHKVRVWPGLRRAQRGPLHCVPSPQPTPLSLASWLAPGSTPEESRGRREEAMMVYQEGCSQSPWAPGLRPSGRVETRQVTGPWCILIPCGCSTSPRQRPCPDHPLRSSSLRGPPGHAEDLIADGLELPELQVGDWLIFEDMGAYTIATSSLLGGCPQPQITYAMSRVAW